jgi:RimJ/RimL family protein N-acetyltransferase
VVVLEPEPTNDYLESIRQQLEGLHQMAKAHENSEGLQEHLLVRFQTRPGSVVEFVEYHEHLFEPLVAMYEAFEPKRGAQGLPPLGRDRILTWLRPLLSENLNLLALHGDKVIGHTMLCPVPLRRGCAEFAIFVHHDFRNQGIGTEFTRATLNYGKEKGLHQIWLTVEVNNFPAIRVYKKLGFQISGTYYPEVEMLLNFEVAPTRSSGSASVTRAG